MPNTAPQPSLVDALTYFVLLCSAHARTHSYVHVHARTCSLTNVPIGPSHFERLCWLCCAVLYCVLYWAFASQLECRVTHAGSL